MREAFAYNLPPLATQLFAAPGGEAPAIAFSNPAWMPAALKRREDGAGFIVRLWNASDEEQSGTVRVALPFGAVHRARLDEQPEGPLAANGDTLELRTRPFEIVTLSFDDPAG